MINNFIKSLIIFTLFGVISCKSDAEKPKLSYTKKTKVIEKQIDTTKVLVADLPIQFDGTKYLIFPIGEISNENPSNDFTISNNMDNEITGYLKNLKFQMIGTDSLTSLTDKPILLESTTFLKSLSDKHKKQILVHQLADNDSNDDGKLDTNDIKSLYLSDISGQNLKKISSDFQEVLTWKIIDSQNRLYFKAIEDTNKNGQFDKNDKIHYNYVNLLEKDWKAIEIYKF